MGALPGRPSPYRCHHPGAVPLPRLDPGQPPPRATERRRLPAPRNRRDGPDPGHSPSVAAGAEQRHRRPRLQLSGGERKRLAIARMLLREPEIVVLDEATSHLDNTTEHALQEALRPFLRNRTCLVVAHRLSTVRHADLILVLADGEVTEQGTHTELLHHDGLYRRLLSAQPPPRGPSG
ncbi:ATP-binding cassette domain-containing protein [Streptomyces sp. NPDC023838]|uniref:ATP-binding cassette domain-containing protein n=1 Tax=Streptomyces sp. NPDC023838 TaxID=3154325 RepID=UPI00340741CE